MKTSIQKERETPAEPLYTDNDIYEEKRNFNISPLQTTKKNATIKISEKVNCNQCGIEIRKDSLRRHIKAKHQKEEPSCVCVYIENAIFMDPKNNKHQCYPLHVQKKIHSGTDSCLSCESDFCMNYMCAKSGLKSGIRTSCCSTKYLFSRACFSARRNFGFLGTW